MSKFRYCDACGNQDENSLKRVYQVDGYDVLKCKVCGFVYVNNPALTKVCSELFQDAGTVETHHRYRDVLMAVGESHCKDFQKLSIEKGSSILDFGCGNGYFLSIAQSHGMKVLGLEINKAAAEYGRQELGVDIIAEPPPYPSLTGKKFDVITMWGVIEHLPKPSLVLKLLRSHMHEDSWLIIQTPSEDALVRRAVHLLNRILRKQWLTSSMYQSNTGTHTQCFNRKSIRILLGRLRFQIREIEDATYGFRYMVKKPGLMGGGLKVRLKRAIALAGFMLSFVGHKNHMVVYAKLRKI